MAKRLQVLLDEEEYLEIQAVARRQRLTLAEWVRQALRKAKADDPATVETKPMYLVGAAHPNKDRALAILTQMVRDGE